MGRSRRHFKRSRSALPGLCVSNRQFKIQFNQLRCVLVLLIKIPWVLFGGNYDHRLLLLSYKKSSGYVTTTESSFNGSRSNLPTVMVWAVFNKLYLLLPQLLRLAIGWDACNPNLPSSFDKMTRHAAAFFCLGHHAASLRHFINLHDQLTRSGDICEIDEA